MRQSTSGASGDSWDLVLEQLGRRPFFRVGIAILTLLYGAAIFAPLIANDRPYYLEALDLRDYNAALRSLSPVSASIVRLMEQDDAAYLASRGELAPATWGAALALEQEALDARLGVLDAALAQGEPAELAEFRARMAVAIESGRAGRREEAAQVAREARELARELKKQLAPAAASGVEPGADSAGEASGALLHGTRRFPLFESLHPLEIFFMGLWLALATWPLWNPLVNRALLGGDRERIRRARRRKFAGITAVSLAAALAFAFLVGGERQPFATAPFKSGLDDGGIVLAHGDWSASRTPIFAPIPMGYAETHPEEAFRPPTWTRSSKRDGEGRPVPSGAQPGANDLESVPAPGAANPGTSPVPVPVEVRYAELPRNAPLRHPAGTDSLGRDLLVRLLWGARVSLSVGILSAFLLTVLGVLAGSLAGYFGGWVDLVVMRVIEVLQSIPAFFLIIVTMAFTDPDVVPPILSIVFVIAIVRWTGVARLVRAEFLRLREAEFVLAARALGYSKRRTMFVHILPNALGPVLVSAAFAVASGILTESAVSFLGFGIQHPGASWGSLVNESKSAEHWWVQLFPGLLILLTVTCYNLVGDAVRDALDPKLQIDA